MRGRIVKVLPKTKVQGARVSTTVPPQSSFTPHIHNRGTTTAQAKNLAWWAFPTREQGFPFISSSKPDLLPNEHQRLANWSWHTGLTNE